MSTVRRFGQEVDGNARRGPNMSLETRDHVIGMIIAGATVKEAAEACGRSPRAVRDLYKKYQQTGYAHDKARSGRPPVLSPTQKNIIHRAARKEPKGLYKTLTEAAQIALPDGSLSTPPSHSTLYRVLKKQGLRCCRCKKRPKLTHGHALARLRFCRLYRNFGWAQRTFKFSDECSVQKGVGHSNEWCFRYDHEKWKKSMITEVSTSRKPAQMVWALIWLDERGRPRRSNLVIMERDPSAPRGGYSSKSYIKALRQGLLPHWQRSQVFMHDNAPIHTSQESMSFLADHGITPINWPKYSPDLNPIEHLWWHLKKRMYTFYPQYNSYMKSQEEWDGFCEALKECWRGIPGSLIKRLILSMPRRLAACRHARGWQTKY